MRDIKLKIDGLTPQFLKEQAPQLVLFIKYYYEWLESSTDINGVFTDFKEYQDIDLVPDRFLDFLANEFLVDIPPSVLVDRRRLIKNIKEFYLAKGSEKAVRLLFRILFDEEIDFYYPKVDILRVSDGNWVVDRSITIYAGLSPNTHILQNDDLITNFNRMGSKARVNTIQSSTNNGVTTYEVFLSNIIGDFQLDDTITVANTFAGTVTSNGIFTYPGRWDGTDGFISDVKKIQDGYYYQDFSYEISSSESKNLYQDAMYNLVHPAGMKLFGKVSLFELVDASTFLDVDFESLDFKEFDIEIIQTNTVGTDTYMFREEKVIDYPTLINFSNITIDATGLSGLISIFANTSVAAFANISVAALASVPVDLIGTKQVVYGNPLFAGNTSSPTSFTGYFNVGSQLGLGNGIFYTISQIYSDDVLLLQSPYAQGDFFDLPFFGKQTQNIIENTITPFVTIDNTINLTFTTNTYTYFGYVYPENFVFKNYTNTRHPLNVPTSNTFVIPIKNGIYTILYTYSNSSTFAANSTVTGESYTFNSTAKNTNVNSIVFTKVG